MQNIAQNADAQDAAQAAIAKAAKECACGNFATSAERLSCTAETTRTFAPGHDAKLKGFLIRAGREGRMIRVLGEPVEITPQAAAARFGFGHMVAEGIARPARTKKAKADAAPAAPELVAAKVGRWTYEGVILAAGDGTPVFRYTNAKGAVVDTMKFAV